MAKPRFIPSSYGDGEVADAPALPEAAKAPSVLQTYVEQYAPALSKVLFGADAREEAAVITAKIQNYRDLAERTTLGPLRNFYVLEINKMEQRLTALTQQAEEQQAYSDALRASQLLGLGVLVIGGVALTAFAVRQISDARLSTLQRQQLSERR